MNRYLHNIAYLEKKFQGGTSNFRGGKYEQYFAVWLVAQLSNRFEPRQWSEILITTQAYEFVDDLMVSEPDRHSFFQLKSGQQVSWGKNEKRSLFFDFLNQVRKSRVSMNRLALHVVVSSERQQKRLVSSRPAPIRKWTSVDYFPNKESIAVLVAHHTNFKTEIANLCALENPTNEALVSISKCLLGVWVGSSQNKVSIDELIEDARGVIGIYLRPRLRGTLQAATVHILDVIPGLVYNSSSGYLSWWFGQTDAGNIPYAIGSSEMDAIELNIQRLIPRTFAELETIIII